MSYFSQAIDAYMDKAGLTNEGLAKATGLNHTDFSRFRRDVVQPTDKAMRKLVKQVPLPTALHLIVCWLRDATPEDFREKISIRPVTVTTEHLAPDDWTRALHFFTAEGEHNPLVRQTLVGMHRLMTRTAATTKAPAAPMRPELNESTPGAPAAAAPERETPTPYPAPKRHSPHPSKKKNPKVKNTLNSTTGRMLKSVRENRSRSGSRDTSGPKAGSALDTPAGADSA